MHMLLARVQKNNKFKIWSLLIAVGWKFKIGPRFCNPWGPTILAQKKYFMHRLFARAQKNNRF